METSTEEYKKKLAFMNQELVSNELTKNFAREELMKLKNENSMLRNTSRDLENAVLRLETLLKEERAKQFHQHEELNYLKEELIRNSRKGSEVIGSITIAESKQPPFMESASPFEQYTTIPKQQLNQLRQGVQESKQAETELQQLMKQLDQFDKKKGSRD